jgi:hypothetical protein
MYRDEQPKSDTQNAAPQPKPKAKSVPPLMGGIMGAAVLMSGVEKSIGNPTQDHIEVGQQLLAQIPQDLQDLAHDPNQVGLLFYAFMFPQKELPASVSQVLDGFVDQKIFANAHEKVGNLPRNALLPLIDIAMPAFKANPLETRRKIFETVEKLASLDKQRLYHFALVSMLERNTEDKTPKDSKTKYTSFDPVLDQISTLMLFLILCGDKNKENSKVLFEKIMLNFTPNKVEPPELDTSKAIKLHAILRELNLLAPLCKEKLIRACLECVAQDNVITLNEAELVRAVAACLGCPIPPIIPSVPA